MYHKFILYCSKPQCLSYNFSSIKPTLFTRLQSIVNITKYVQIFYKLLMCVLCFSYFKPNINAIYDRRV
jgi:hypothetical protein